MVPLPPGGTNDIMARIIGERMTKTLGQQVVIENRAAGGSGTVATRQVARATPGRLHHPARYTTTFATGPSMYKNAGYDVRKDFAPIGLIAVSPSLVLANKDFPINDHPRADRAHPKDQRAVPVRSARHRQRQSSRRRDVRARRQDQADADPLQGLESAGDRSDRRPRQDRLQSDPGVARRASRADCIRALAVTSAKRSSQLPDVADARGTGTARLRRLAALRPVCAGRHAAAIVAQLNKALNAALADEAVIKRIRHEGAEPKPTTPQQYAADIDAEETRWSAVVKDLGIVGN